MEENKKENCKDNVHGINLDLIAETAENKIDVKKVNDIRLALRKRYAYRINFRKIFKDWDRNDKGEISIFDAKDMINRFGIPINFNETRALFLSCSTRNTETLNMQEFMNLISSDNEALKFDGKNFMCKYLKL